MNRNNPTCESCSLQTNWGSTDTLYVVTRDIFAVWWYPKFDHETDANVLLDKLIPIRADCVYNLGMSDPPNPGQGFFYNVYIHHDDQGSYARFSYSCYFRQMEGLLVNSKLILI